MMGDSLNPQSFKVLVVDDEIGREGDHQEQFLRTTDKSADAFVFSTGQDSEGKNRVTRVVEEVRSLWEGHNNVRLSLAFVEP